VKKRGKKSEEKASVIHRYEGPWQLGNGKKSVAEANFNHDRGW